MIVRLLSAALLLFAVFIFSRSARAQAAPAEVAVDAGALTPQLLALLRFERPDVAFTSSTATSATRVSLKRDRELLSLEVSEDGEPRIERTIIIERERLQPALRVAALLVVEAIPPPPASAAMIAPAVSSPNLALLPEAPPATPWLRFQIAGSGDLWVSPRIGLTFAAHYVVNERWSIGLRVSSSGLLCCGEIDTATLRGRQREVTLFADTYYRLTMLGGTELALAGAIGPSFATFKGIATYPGGMSPEQNHPWTVEGTMRGALSLRTQPIAGRLRFVLDAGIRLRLERMIIQLPEEIRTADSGLDPGIASPFLELGVALDLP